MAKNNNSLIVIIVLIVLILGFGGFKLFSVATASTPTFYQYFSDSCGGLNCGYTNALIKSPSTEFIVGDNTFKFETGLGDWGQCGLNPGGYIIPSCCSTTKVYKDGTLIDTLKKGFAGDLVNTNTQTNKNYESDGGGYIQINVGTWDNFYASACRNYQNSYTFGMGSNSVELLGFTEKTNYKLGENITLKIKVINHLQDLKGKLKINYNIPTFLGSSTRTDISDVDVKSGENYFYANIPSNENINLLKIVPELELYIDTSNFKNVNYDFSTGTLKPIDSQPSFKILSVVDTEIDLSVGNTNVNQTNLPQNSSNTEDTVDTTSGSFDLNSFWEQYKMIIIIVGGILLLLFLIGRR